MLKTHDVGEADRFCILFSKERGKIAVRARAARKLKSNLGGTLLPLQSIQLDIRDSKSGLYAQSAICIQPFDSSNIDRYFLLQEVAQFILQVIIEDDPMPELFDAYCTLLTVSQCSREVVLSFKLFTLEQLGLLPSLDYKDLHDKLSENEKIFIQQSQLQQWHNAPSILEEEFNRLSKWIRNIIQQHSAS